MANLITITNFFDGAKAQSTRAFNGDLVDGLSWTPEKSSQTLMTFTDGTTWSFEANATKTSTVLNKIASIITSPTVGKKLTFPSSIGLKNISTADAKMA
jgi:hypothetical protein